MLKDLVSRIKEKYLNWKYRNEYTDILNDYDFIWGVKSYDDLSESECNLYTMNDIDITYNKNEKKYFMSIETIYSFRDGKDGEKRYIKRLFDGFTKFMIDQGYDINQEIQIYDVFTDGNNINTEYDSIEELYANFKFLANAFVNQ